MKGMEGLVLFIEDPQGRPLKKMTFKNNVGWKEQLIPVMTLSRKVVYILKEQQVQRPWGGSQPGTNARGEVGSEYKIKSWRANH